MAPLDWADSECDSDDSVSVVTVLSDPPQPVEYLVKVKDGVRLSLTRTRTGGWMQRTVSSPGSVPSYEYMLPSLHTKRRQQFAAYRHQRQELADRYNSWSKEANTVKAELRDAVQIHSHPTCNLSFRTKNGREDVLRRREDAADEIMSKAAAELDELDNQRRRIKE